MLAIEIAVVLLGGVSLCVALMLLARRRAPDGGYLVDRDAAESVFEVLGTGFAVLIAFVVFVSFDGFVRARDGASQEAVATSQLFRVARLFGDEAADPLREDLRCYARAVVDEEWPLLVAGNISEDTQAIVERIEARVDDLDPSVARTSAALQHWLDQQAERREGRRLRVIDGTRIVPDILWLGLLLGAALVIGFTLLLADPRERRWVQACVMGAVSTMVLTGLMVVRVLDLPYQNGLITPSEMQVTIALMDRELGGGGVCGPNAT